MFSRLLLAAALSAPQASAWLHALEAARAEADHPVCTAGSAAHLEPASGHKHHDEDGCSQCPRPSQGALQASGSGASAPPAPLLVLPGPASKPAPADASASPRGPPGPLSA